MTASVPRPAPAALALLLLWAALGLAVTLEVVDLRVWYAAGAGLLVLLLADAVRVLRRPTPRVTRRMPDTWPVGIERPVTLNLEVDGRQRVDVFDLHPGGWNMQGLPRRWWRSWPGRRRGRCRRCIALRTAGSGSRVSGRLRSPM